MQSLLSAYDAHIFNLDFNREKKRLNAQVDLFWTIDSKFFKRHIPLTVLSIIDIGCGTGRLVYHLRGLFSKAKIIGIDTDGALLNEAKQSCGPEKGKVPEFVQGSAHSLNFADGSFHVAIIRLVLEHLADPLAVLQEVFRILPVGGSVIVIDNDFDFHLRTWPNIPELDDYYVTYCRARENGGGHPKIGRQLPMLLQQSGFSDISFEVLCAHNAVISDQFFLDAEGLGIPTQLVKTGYLDRKFLAKLTRKWVAMLKTNNHVIVRPMFYAVGIKKTGRFSS